jgi:DNA-binding response OmpR family regulator
MDARKQARTYDGIIHLLLTDVGLPDMNGLELAAAISKERPGITVMAMSGQSLPIIPAELLRALFQKPFRLSDLVNRVRHEMEKGSSPFT